MGHVFISYSHKDKVYVHKLQEALQDEGFDAWIDDRIDYGDEWLRVITKQVDECDAFLLVMSENSLESYMVQNEVVRAYDKKKPIFPLLLEGDNWLIVQAKQYVPVIDGTLPPEKFFERLSHVATRVKKVPEPTPQKETHKPPPNIQSLMNDAEDAYYAAEYNVAIRLYQKVLRLEPENLRARDQLAKVELLRAQVGATKSLPVSAQQFYRRSRSYIAARLFSEAIMSLEVAISEAEKAGMKYPDAEDALRFVSNSLEAEKLGKKASSAFENNEWANALALYNRALMLDPTNRVLKNEMDLLQTGLLLLRGGVNKPRIFVNLNQARKTLLTAKEVVDPKTPLLEFVEKQINQVRLIQVGMIIVLLLFLTYLVAFVVR